MMNATDIYEVESVTRSIARWGSVAAAIIFGAALMTDERMSWGAVSNHAVHVGVIVVIFAIFAGYALAWTKRFEILGSVIALVSMLGVFAIFGVTSNWLPDLFFLAVGAPAAFHLVAVAMHRALTRVAA